MAEADLSAAELDLRVTHGDDILLTLLFSVDLAGYGGWEAQARPEPDDGTHLDFAVDTSQAAASQIITIRLPGGEAAGISTGWVYAILVTAPFRRTLVRGRITVEQTPTR